MYPRVTKPQGEMHPKDYEIYAAGLDMKVAQPQDKVEIMEETQWVVTFDFLKTCRQLKKKDEQLKAIRERVIFLEKKEKSLEADVACMTKGTSSREWEEQTLGWAYEDSDYRPFYGKRAAY